MDSFSASRQSHETESIRHKLDRIKCQVQVELVIVPAGQTGKYQALDTGRRSVESSQEEV